MDILIKNADIITMDHASVIKNGFVGITGGRISYVGESAPEKETKETIDAAGRILMPGLINAHTHLAMTLMRGYADDLDLHTWLNDYIFPAEDKLDGRSTAAGALLGIAESIASGITALSDMYFFCDEIAQAAADAGIKANIAQGFTCFDPDADFYSIPAVENTIRLHEKWHGFDNGRIRIDACIHAEYTSAPKYWPLMAELAAERGLGMQVHISETKKEHEECIARHGTTPTKAFHRAGLFKSRVTAAHCVWVDEEDMDILASTGATVVANPISNLKLASGIAPVSRMLERGINVAIGTDGASSNNSLDMLEEIKLTAMLHKGSTLDPLAVPAATALRMATANGARAQGREYECGVIAAGFDADMVLIDADKPHMIPRHDVVSNVAYSARGGDVSLTMVRGRILYKNGEFLTIDMERLKQELGDYVLPHLFGSKGLI